MNTIVWETVNTIGNDPVPQSHILKLMLKVIFQKVIKYRSTAPKLRLNEQGPELHGAGHHSETDSQEVD